MEKQPKADTLDKSTVGSNPCGVDLNWLAGRKIAKVTNDLAMLTFEFDDGLVFKVQALNYKGEPFVAITPYRDPNAAD